MRFDQLDSNSSIPSEIAVSNFGSSHTSICGSLFGTYFFHQLFLIVGQASEIVGPKASIEVMNINVDAAWVQRNMEPLFTVQKYSGKREPKMRMMVDFCPIVFNPANQIIHPAVYWGLFRRFDGRGVATDSKWFPNEWY